MAETMTRFWPATGASALIDSTVENIFQVTAAHTYVIRHIHISNGTATAYTVTIGVGTSATPATNDVAGQRILDAFTIPAGNTFDWSGNFVMPASEYMFAKSSGDDLMTMWVNGVDIS